MITVKVNNEEHQFSTTVSLQEILEQLKITSNGIAVAVNQNIITKSDWSITKLNHNDAILIIKATQGG